MSNLHPTPAELAEAEVSYAQHLAFHEALRAAQDREAPAVRAQLVSDLAAAFTTDFEGPKLNELLATSSKEDLVNVIDAWLFEQGIDDIDLAIAVRERIL